MQAIRAAMAATVFMAALALPGWAAARSAQAERPVALADAGSPSDLARTLMQAIAASGDAQGRPYAIVDKREARIWLFDAQGHAVAGTPVLLGEAVGDTIAPQVGEHAQQGHVPLAERTTPAGRFEAEPGPNAQGEQVLWLDWDAAFAIHRLRPGRSQSSREQRLAERDPALHRVSWGCVVVPVAFFEGPLKDWAAGARPVVYVMPEAGDAPALLASH